MFVGAHISKKKTFQDTIDVILNNGGNALQIFSGSPRSAQPRNVDDPKYAIPWEIPNNKPFALVIHAPYTINLAMPCKNGKRTIDIHSTYWFKCIINELLIADKMGAMGVIIHVGKYTTQDPKEALKTMRTFILAVLEKKCELDIKSLLILETASGQGTELLTNINELCVFYHSIVYQNNYKNHFRLCLDTCHVWSCGYGCLESYKEIQSKTNFGIVCIHLNGSATPEGSHKDRHDQILSKKSSIPQHELIEMISIVDDNVVIIIETPNEEELEIDIDFVKNAMLKT